MACTEASLYTLSALLHSVTCLDLFPSQHLPETHVNSLLRCLFFVCCLSVSPHQEEDMQFRNTGFLFLLLTDISLEPKTLAGAQNNLINICE